MPEPDDREDYLKGEDEEINEFEDPDWQLNPEAEDADAAEAKTFGKYQGQDELEKSILDIKSLNHDEFFQNRSKKESNDMNTLNKYTEFAGLIFDLAKQHIGKGTKPDATFGAEVGPALQEGLNHFFEIIANQPALNVQDSQARDLTLKKHFIDWPFCHEKRCLGPD